MKNTAVFSPAELGLDVARVDALRGRLQHAIDKGPLPSIQVAVARHGRLAYFETFGAADSTTRYSVFSCTKPIVASAIWKLMGEGALDITHPVSRYLPLFAGGGKEHVTVEQLLCHTCGFPNGVMAAPHWLSSEARLERMATWELEWLPGTQMVYHPLSAHWVLAELINAITGRDFREVINQDILQPLGLAALRLGVRQEEGDDIALLTHVGEPPSTAEAQLLTANSMNWPSMQDDSLLMFNDPDVRAVGVPGGGAVSTAADMALFYQALMHNSEQLWDDRVLHDATAIVRVNFTDPMTGAPANRGLGVVIAGADKYVAYRGMGDKVSPRAFGHQGVGGQVAWGDPHSGLSFCLLTNGLDAHPIRSAHLCAAASNRAGACVPRSAQ